MRKQIEKLINSMKSHDVDVYMITDTDWHMTEYTSPHFQALEEFSGFSGGDGRLVVTSMGEAALWTDGRYFEQAEKELKGSGIKLMRIGERGVPKQDTWIRDRLPQGGCFGVDGKCLSYEEGKRFKETFPASAIFTGDLTLDLWQDRPLQDIKPCWLMSEKHSGKSGSEKLNKLREEMKNKGANWCIVTALDDVAWVLNLRGDDIPYTPVFMAFLIVGVDSARLYTDGGHFKADGVEALRSIEDVGILVQPYEMIYEDAKKLDGAVLLDPSGCNYELASCVSQSARIIEGQSPVAWMKCRKNKTEYENLKLAQHKDSVALTKFIYWFKQNVAKGNLTEWTAVEKLHNLRAEQEGFIEESFSTISAYGANASMAHYGPSAKRDVKIKPVGFYLVDSGGQYMEGTTDVTRTIACGKISEEEKENFTLVLMANLRLANMKFLEGCQGALLDGCVREIFWSRGLNFNHGTGHGVGFCLSVHEGPCGISYKTLTNGKDCPIYEGMYISDEPGIYFPGKYGIRTENMLFAKHDYRNEYGNFLKFETMTLCPIDKDCLKVDIMEDKDIELLNNYHERVFKELRGDFEGESLKWLKKACAPLRKV